MYNSETHAVDGKAMYPLPSEEASPIAYGLNVYGGNRIWSIGAKSEYPELCMAILNWLSTPEGRMTAEYGPKDVYWYYDENGRPASLSWEKLQSLISRQKCQTATQEPLKTVTSR